MKKNRPGVLLSVLAPEAGLLSIEDILFREIGTFGIRRYPASRHKLRREAVVVETAWGPVQGKRGWRGWICDIRTRIRGLCPAGSRTESPVAGGLPGCARGLAYSRDETMRTLMTTAVLAATVMTGCSLFRSQSDDPPPLPPDPNRIEMMGVVANPGGPPIAYYMRARKSQAQLCDRQFRV